MPIAEPTERLQRLAEELASAYVEHCRPRAILLVGSGATGGVDGFSDVDMILYYDTMPKERELATARARVGAERVSDTD